MVCLAAAVAMLETNLLMLTMGKAPDSFVVMDVRCLPLRILTGMGFIGTCAIFRRGDVLGLKWEQTHGAQNMRVFPEVNMTLDHDPKLPPPDPDPEPAQPTPPLRDPDEPGPDVIGPIDPEPDFAGRLNV